jgi:N-acetylmuramoyl-L-alanine amidase
VCLVALVATLAAGRAEAQTSARELYTQAVERERAVRDAGTPALDEIRAAIQAYERVVRRFPRSGYTDNALWQAGGLALLAYERFHDDTDRRNGERRLRLIKTEYPASRFVARVDDQVRRFSAAARPAAPAPPSVESPKPPPAAVPPPPANPAPAPAPAGGGTALIRRIVRQDLPAGVRVIIELDSEAEYHEDRLPDPPRVFFDLKGVGVSPALNRDLLAAPDDVIKAIRLGQRPGNSTRVVIELAGEPRYTVFTLYDPYRLVIDFERKESSPAAPARATGLAAPAPTPANPVPDSKVPSPTAAPPRAPTVPAPVSPPAPLPAKPPAPSIMPVPVAPSRNSDGTFSLARQLGLGISRIVIDPGHGGHDPGAQAAGLTEANLVLDVAQLLEALLLKEPGVEVALTRRTDVFIPLEERTAIANRDGADLFLSIHANASRNRRANGIETYYLNFATNPEAEAVAARENSASGRTMHNLPDIVQAIALNTKLDESRDLARMVQDAMIRRLKPQYRSVRSLGVKQAPFVVLIGAQMPSVLAEVSFITNKTESSLLGKATYRQRIAQALFDAVMRYQRSLKTSKAVAQRVQSP